MASASENSDRRISRRNFLRAGVLGLGAASMAGLLACSPATQPVQQTAAPAPAKPAATSAPAAVSKKVTNFRIAHGDPIGGPIDDWFKKWIQVLEEKSGGALKAEYFPASQLGSYTQLIEMNRMGTVAISTGGPDTEAKLAPIVAALSVPYVFKDTQHVDKVLQGPLGQLVSDQAKAKTGVEFVAYGEEGFRHIFTKRPVQTLADFKGLKIRVSEQPISLRMVQLLGGNPTPIPYAELYNALQGGVVDGAEQSVFGIEGYKFYEPAPNITLTYHWFNPKPIRVNAKWLESLPADLQKVVRDTAKSVFAEQRTDARKRVEGTTEKLKGLGAKFYEVDLKPWREATAPQIDEYIKEYPEAADILKQVQDLAK